MASAARGESSNPYGVRLRTGGKSQKPMARSSQETPYDRSVRSFGLGSRGCGWLLKWVDLALRLIRYCGNRLFFFFFRKRETPLRSRQRDVPRFRPFKSDEIQETKVGHREETSALSMRNDLIRMEDANGSVNPTKDGFTDLEKNLKETTFTRSEVDRLITLLRSKAADPSTVTGESEK